MRSHPAKIISIACVFALLVFPLVGENVRDVQFPVADYVLPDTQWVPPPPHGRPVLDDISGEKTRSGLYYGSRVLMAAGGLLCAGGIVLTARGFSDNMDSDLMHTGGLMIISGALVSAIFSVVSRASAESRESGSAQSGGAVAP